MNSHSVKLSADFDPRATDTIVIRPARIDDLDSLVDLELHSFTTDRLSRAQYRRHILGATALVLVAVRERVLLGSIVVFLRAGSDEARLYSVAVSDRARGRRIGDALVESAEASVRAHGRHRIRLEVRQDNPAAIRLYERRGYVRFGEITGFYEDSADAWRYRKILS
jgi:[ribosomal protein S18]-alanine N-acetyltransferase